MQWINTLAYFVAASMMNKTGFMRFALVGLCGLKLKMMTDKQLMDTRILCHGIVNKEKKFYKTETVKLTLLKKV